MSFPLAPSNETDRQTDACQQTSPVQFPPQSAAPSRNRSVPLKTPADRPPRREDTQHQGLPAPSQPADNQPQGHARPCHLPEGDKAPRGPGGLRAVPRAQRQPLRPRVPSPTGLAEGATLPPRLQKSPAGRWPGTPPVRQRGGQEQICPPCQALSHGKVPAESGTAEPGSSLCRSVTAWGRLRGAGRDRLASPSPFTRLRSKSAEMLRRRDGRVPSPACPQLHGTLPKSCRNLFP